MPGAAAFRNAVRDRPLRYVLSDELVRCATQLAYAEGDRLAGCLDLIQVPARALWVEWSEPARLELCRRFHRWSTYDDLGRMINLRVTYKF